MSTEHSRARDRSLLEAFSLELLPCEPDAHGAFIRVLTRENFYNTVSRTVGWDEERHQQEPRFPERYRMVQRNGEMIGFFCIREAADHLYLHTIQLVSVMRGRGYGTALLQHIESIAKSKGLPSIQLRVFKNNPAQRLYRRLGYTPLETDERSLILIEKVL